jgi:eukaryotic-like serine/threonine-protein kinase
VAKFPGFLARLGAYGQDWGVRELTPGTFPGHYKIIRRLGQGGMGVVYEAADQKLGRHVAVKLLIETTHNDNSALERFWREARAASSLNHPGICTIHELNESAEMPFIVMELMEGNSLEKLYRGRPTPYPKLLETGVQLADALEAAHRKGILHRDIKRRCGHRLVARVIPAAWKFEAPAIGPMAVNSPAWASLMQ